MPRRVPNQCMLVDNRTKKISTRLLLLTPADAAGLHHSGLGGGVLHLTAQKGIQTKVYIYVFRDRDMGGGAGGPEVRRHGAYSR